MNNESHLIGRSRLSAQREALGVREVTLLSFITAKNFADLSKIATAISMILKACSTLFLWHELNIIPHSQEEVNDSPMETGEIASGNELTANVGFDDAHAGFSDSRGTASDPLRWDLVKPDASLASFFKRPLKVSELTWQVGDDIFQQIDPWSLYFENKRVINRIANYKLMRAILKVKFVLNGNAFYFGRALASYRPLPNLDNTTLLRPGNFDDLVEASQRPHVYLNPTLSQGGELVLPFFTPQNMLDIPSSQWSTMGKIDIDSLTTLKQANGGNTPINISVFVWCEDIDLVGLTESNPGSIVPQGMDEAQGIISKPASVVAKTASLFTTIPYIGNFATATEIGARAIGSMAALFGFSKPTEPKICPFQPISRQSLAVCDGTENTLKLTVDSKNELSVDPLIGGLDMPDELTILSIAGRESILTKFDWAVGASPETLIFNCIVDPCVTRVSSLTPTEYHMPALAFATFPFTYWKGTLRYRFQFICSGFHKGRVKFVYDPEKTPSGGSTEYNVVYTEIVDLAEKNDFTIDVGWGRSTTWVTHVGVNQTIGSGYSGAFGITPATPLTYNTSSPNNPGNGTLSVYVVNELTTPDSTVFNDIECVVSVCACDDFEVAAPTDLYLSQMGLRSSANANIVPQGADEEMLNLENPVTGSQSIRKFGSDTQKSDLINRIHMGEAVASFRSLLRRYNLSEIMYPASSTNDVELVRFTRTMFPIQGGYTSLTSSDSDLIVDLSLYDAGNVGNYVFANNTLMNYLVRAYGGWRGGVRYTTDTTARGNPAIDNIGDLTWNVGRLASGDYRFNAQQSLRPSDDIFPVDDNPASPNAKSQILRGTLRTAGRSGATRWNTEVNPIQSYEIPYYSQYRFAPGRRGTVYNSDDVYQDSFVLETTMVPGTRINPIYQYVSAAEDFTMFFYLSPPIVYFQYAPQVGNLIPLPGA